MSSGTDCSFKYDPKENVFVSDGDFFVAKDKIPNIMWHITDICPLNCPYCFAPKTTDVIDANFVDKIVSRLPVLGVQKVDLSGGEPLSHPALPRIINALSETGIFATLTTSGVGIAKNKTYISENLDKLSRVIVSIDGPDEASHSDLRGFPRAWVDAMSFLRSIPAVSRRSSVRINTVVTSKFDLSWINEFQTWLTELGVREWCLIEPHPANAKPSFDLYSIDEGRFEEVASEAKRTVTGLRVLFRRRSQYSTYWSLQPGGILRQHSDSALDRNDLNLIESTVLEIESHLQGLITMLPTRRTDEIYKF